MVKRSVEDVMNDIEDFLNSCKTSALSSNKVILPRDEFDELFSDLKVKIPAEIDRCKKIMRNKEAILMDARKTADGIIAQANQQVNFMMSETEVMKQANQKAYETVEMARIQANDILAKASAQANEIRLGSMQYTNDIMMGIRNYVEATMEAEKANYENLLQVLNNDYVVVNANIEEVQNQIADFTGDVNLANKPPKMKMVKTDKTEEHVSKAKTNMVDKVKKAVGVKDNKNQVIEKPIVNIPDFVSSGDKVVPSEIPLKSTEELKQEQEIKNMNRSVSETSEKDDENQKLKKKIVKKRNPVIHQPHTAQETVARTLEAAGKKEENKTVYKANGEEARAVSSSRLSTNRNQRTNQNVSRSAVQTEDFVEVETDADDFKGKQMNSVGVIDDYSMDKKF